MFHGQVPAIHGTAASAAKESAEARLVDPLSVARAPSSPPRATVLPHRAVPTMRALRGASPDPRHALTQARMEARNAATDEAIRPASLPRRWITAMASSMPSASRRPHSQQWTERCDETRGDRGHRPTASVQHVDGRAGWAQTAGPAPPAVHACEDGRGAAIDEGDPVNETKRLGAGAFLPCRGWDCESRPQVG